MAGDGIAGGSFHRVEVHELYTEEGAIIEQAQYKVKVNRQQPRFQVLVLLSCALALVTGCVLGLLLFMPQLFARPLAKSAMSAVGAALVAVQALIAFMMWRAARTMRTRLLETQARAAGLSQAHESDQQAISALQQRVAEQERLAESLENLSAPLIPIAEGVVVVPLFGTVGAARVRRVQESLLQGVERHRARVVIIDLTGAELTRETAQHFTQILSGVDLMGCQVVLTGIGKQIARDLLDWDIELSVETCRDLRAGVAYATGLLANGTLSPGSG